MWLKKKENIQATNQYRTRNLCFLTSLLYHYTTRLIRQISAKFNYKTWRSLRLTKWNANLILLREYAELVALCKVIVWKTHIPVRTQK